MKYDHYANKYSTVDIAEDWKLSGPLFNVLKYIQRRGRKGGNAVEQDLLKAIWYLVYELTKDKETCDKVLNMLGVPLTINTRQCMCPECTKVRLVEQSQI